MTIFSRKQVVIKQRKLVPYIHLIEIDTFIIIYEIFPLFAIILELSSTAESISKPAGKKICASACIYPPQLPSGWRNHIIKSKDFFKALSNFYFRMFINIS